MKKSISLVLALLLSVSLFAGCGKAQTSEGSKELNLYTWEGMFPQDVLDGFTAETGIKINYSGFDLDETMLSKLEAAKGGDYDVVIADDYIIETAISKGLVQKLDSKKIENSKNINPVFQNQFFDKTNEYTVPYASGIQTIVYNPEVIKKDIKSYADLWDVALKDNIGVVGNYRVINGMALKVLGESYNTTDVATIEKAGEKLMELAPNIRLIKDDNIQDDLISGEIGAAVMYTSQVTVAMLANPNLKVVFPTEGIGFGIMAQFVPSNAPNAEAAHQFINYLLKPEIAAKCYEHVGYYSTNSAADELINADYKEFLTLPENIDTSKMEMIQNVSPEAEAAHVLVWTEFRSKTGK